MRRMDSHHFREALRDGRTLVLDGGLATQLEAQGADLSDRLWSARLLVEAPDQIVAAHLAFYRAGAQVATTASYQATFEGFAARGLDHEAAADLLRRSVELADRARAQALDEGVAGPLFVAASIGPYGAMLADGSEYRGGYGRTVAELADFHRERFRVLAGTGADVLAVETIPEIEEARAVAVLLGELPGTAAWISFSCADGGHLRGGAPDRGGGPGDHGRPGRRGDRRQLHRPGARRRAHRPHPVGVVAAHRRLPQQRRGLGRGGAGAGREPRPGAWTARRPSAGEPPGPLLIGGCCRVSPSQVGAMGQALAIAAGG